MFTVPFTGGQSLVNLNRRGGQGSSGRRVAPTGYTGIPIWFSDGLSVHSHNQSYEEDPVFASSPTSHPPLQNSDNYGCAIYWPSATVIRKYPEVSLTNVHISVRVVLGVEFSADE